MKWIWIILALIYVLSPYDLIPGVHGVAWIDDIIVLVLLFRYLAKINRLRAAWRQTADNQHQAGYGQTHQDGSPKTRGDIKPPYEILGVSSNATQDEIKAAYRKLANQYHPDKVVHLGGEFQELADKRFKEIQDAYQKLVG